MGIKNLKVILNQNCKNAINVRKLNVYSGMTVAIDLSIFLYKYLYNNNDHIEGLTRLILRLLKSQITPLFVFDGAPPEEKNITLLDRKEKKEILNIKKIVVESCIDINKDNFDSFKEDLQNIINATKTKVESFQMDENEMKDLFDKSKEELEQEVDKIKRKIIYVNSYHTDSSKELFDFFGVRYIHENCEAEALMSVLCKNGIVQACISEDMDTLPCGTSLLLKNFSADKGFVEELCLEGILASLELTHDEFIDVCILCGCDYTQKINLLGPVNALKIIKKYKNIEAFLQDNTKYIIPEHFLNNYQRARYLFNNPVSEEIYNNIDKKIICKKPNINGLQDFLKKSLLKDKYFKEITDNLMNYFLNIEGIYHFDNSNISSIVNEEVEKKKSTKTKKITEYFKKENKSSKIQKTVNNITNTMNLSDYNEDKKVFSVEIEVSKTDKLKNLLNIQ
jgi:flap endonuclease-1